ncbi:MAG: DUF3352 domain-containing protein [Anaerolineae bacterium]|nr:DUF3352 domain-containing protein [Anaerolineae bacterium]
MKKLTILVVIVALLVGALPLSIAAAAPTTDLTALAAYLPAVAPVYVAVDVSEMTIDTLDSLIARIAARLPEGTIPPIQMRTLLDQALSDVTPGVGFEEGVRTWLGDVIALGVISLETQYDDDYFNDNEMPGLGVVQITDRAAAEAFINHAASRDIESGQLVVSSEGGWTVYAEAQNPTNSGILVGDDVAIVAIRTLDEALAGYDDTLDNNPAFVDAFASLPLDTYGAGVYYDIGAVLEAQMAMVQDMMGEIPGGAAEMQVMTQAMAFADTGLALGFTFLDNTALTMDGAMQIDLDAFAELGVPPLTGAIDPAFVTRIPAGAQYVIHSTGIATSYAGIMDALPATAAMQGMDAEEFEQQLRFINVMLRGAIGLNLDELLGWMSGDYAFFLMVDNAALQELFLASMGGETTFETWPFEIGFVTEASDPAAAGAVVAALSDHLEELIEGSANIGVLVTTEELGGGTAVVVTIPVEPTLPPLEILVAANDAVFALGTRGAVEAALAPAAGLDTAASYQEASAYFLPDANQTWYMSGEGLMTLVELFGLSGPAIGDVFDEIVYEMEGEVPPTQTPDEIAAQQQAAQEEARQMMQLIEQFFGLFHSLTISSSVSEDGTVTFRATINLAPELM